MPTYDDGAAMQDIASFVATNGNRFVFVYGQWDPWTGGAFDLGGATDSAELIQAQGTHNSRIGGLAAADQQTALGKLAAWTGVAAALPKAATRSADRPLHEPHVPPAYRRALRATNRSH